MSHLSRKNKSELIDHIHQLEEKLRQGAEKKLVSLDSKAETRFNLLADNLNVGLYRSEAKYPGRIVDANPAFLDMFGYASVEELSLINANDLYVNSFERQVFAENMMKEGLVKNKEFWFKRKDGTKFLGAISTVLIRDPEKTPIYFDGIIEDITEQKQTTIDLIRREEQYRILFNFSPDGIAILNEKGIIIDVNPSFCTLMGQTYDKLVGANVSGLAHVDDKKNVNTNIKKILRGEQLKHTVRNKTNNNKEKYIQLNERKIILPDGQLGIISIAEDITERILTENKLRDSEQKYRLLIENQSDFIVKVDTEGKFLFVSQSYSDFFGKTEKDLLGKKFMVLVHEEDKHKTQEAMRSLFKPPYKAYLEQRAMTKFGWRWISWMDTAILDDQKEVIEIIGVGRDITERKLAEQSLLQSEESYRGLFNSVTDAIYLQDGDGRFVDVNSGAEKMYGYPREYFIGKLPDFLSAPGMNDIEKVTAHIEDAFRGIPQTFEFWGIDKNRRIFPKEVRLNKTSYFGKDVIVAFAHDISKRVNDQQLLVRNEKKLRHIFNAFPDIYFKSDLKGNVKEVSPSVEKITGFKPDEIIGKNSREFYYSQKDFEAISQQFKTSNEIHDFDTRLISKNGGFIECSFTGSLISDEESGKIVEIQGVLRDISERVRNERVIRENERRLSTLMDNLPGMAYQCLNDVHWTMKFVSNGSIALSGYSPESLINNKETAYADLIHTDDQDWVTQKVAEALGHKESFTLTYRIKTKEGQEKWVWEKGTAVYSNADGDIILEGFITDITEQKHAESEIRKLSRAVDQSPNIVMMTDLDGNIIYVNRQFEKTTGYTFEEVLGKNPRILQSGNTPPEVYAELWENLSAGKEWHGEFKNRTKNGKHYWESANIFPLKDNQGRTTHFIGMKEDITLRKNMTTQLIVAKEKAEESDKLKSAFLANMSHEIRTPMNAIIGFSQLLNEEGILAEEREHYIHLIQNSGNDLMVLIDDIIDISKIEAGQMKIFKSQCVLDTILLDLYENFRQILKTQSAKKALKLRYIPSDHPEKIILHTDVDRFKQIFRNLLNNAIKFTDFGSVEFGFSVKPKEEGSTIEFYITDTGIGIQEDKKKIIFESFTQANDSESRLYGGTGLGLAITKKIVEILGGTIWVESKRGYGSTFFFTLPYSDFKPPIQLYPKRKKLKEERFPDFSEKILLLIDTDKASSNFMKKVLLRTNCQVMQTSHSKQIFDEIADHPVSLILIDVNNTQLDGYQSILNFRKKDKKTPIIAISSFYQENEKKRYLQSGCNAFLSKPVNISDLLRAIEKHAL